MLRSTLSVLAGAIAWSLLWVPFNQLMIAVFPHLIDPERYLGHVGVLVGYLVASFVFGITAGYLTAVIARTRPLLHSAALGGVQLCIGIAFEISYWSLLPVWYHLTFLALLLPGNVLGGVLRKRAAVGEAVVRP